MAAAARLARGGRRGATPAPPSGRRRARVGRGRPRPRRPLPRRAPGRRAGMARPPRARPQPHRARLPRRRPPANCTPRAHGAGVRSRPALRCSSAITAVSSILAIRGIQRARSEERAAASRALATRALAHLPGQRRARRPARARGPPDRADRRSAQRGPLGAALAGAATAGWARRSCTAPAWQGVAISPDGRVLATARRRRHDLALGRSHPPAPRPAARGPRRSRHRRGVQPRRHAAGQRRHRCEGAAVGRRAAPAGRPLARARQPSEVNASRSAPTARRSPAAEADPRTPSHRQPTRCGCGTSPRGGRSAAALNARHEHRIERRRLQPGRRAAGRARPTSACTCGTRPLASPLGRARGPRRPTSATSRSARDGRTLASGADYAVRLWDVRSPPTARPNRSPATSASVNSVAFSPDGQHAGQRRRRRDGAAVGRGHASPARGAELRHRRSGEPEGLARSRRHRGRGVQP